MEQDLIGLLDRMFIPEDKDYTQYSPLTLAWLGDSVYDLIVRSILVKRGNIQTAKLHKEASGMVCAKAQARLIGVLLAQLTPEEAAVYRRGHNSSPLHGAKNATKREYLEATGFEALVGYLYLQKNYERLLALIESGWNEMKQASDYDRDENDDS